MLRYVLVVAVSISAIWGQTGTSRIRGVVTDVSGAMVPGAGVAVIHEGTGLQRSMVSNPSGQYAFDAIPLGKYTITITMQGFKRVQSSSNELQVGAPLTVDLAIEPGSVTEQVVVSESSAQVQTAEASLVGEYGAGRNIFTGPGFFQTDFALHKAFPVTERIKVELRGEAFNVFNNVNFSQPNATSTAASFGVISSVRVLPRILQIAAKMTF